MVYQLNDITIDLDNCSLTKDGKAIAVEPQVFDLIAYFITHSNRLVTREEIFQSLWKGRVVSDTSLSNCIKSARKVLGDDGVKQAVIMTKHGRGYQFIGELKETTYQPSPWMKRMKSRKKPALIGFVVLLIGLACLALFLKSKDSVNTSDLGSVHSIAVLPLINNQPNDDTDYFGFAIADQIIGELAYLKNISVRPSSAIREYSSKDHLPLEVGKTLGVEYVLSGSYLKNNAYMRLNIELVDVNTTRMIWRSEPIESAYDDTFKLQDLVIEEVLKGMKLEFSTKELERIRRNDVPSDPLAYEYFLRSIAYPLETKGHQLAIEMLKQSIALDSDYAPAYVQLGDRIRRLAQYGLVNTTELPNTEQYYLKALELNPELLDALGHLSMLYTETNRIEEAAELARKMYVLNPNNANTHFTLGYIYRYAGFMNESIAAMEQAVLLDPNNTKFRSIVGTYSGAREFRKALQMAKQYEPSVFSYGWQALMHRRLGEQDKALQMFEKVIVMDNNGLWTHVANIHKAHMLGDYSIGKEALSKLRQTASSDAETLYYMAVYHCLLNQSDACLDTLEVAINSGYFNHYVINENEVFDGVRQQARFQELLALAQSKHLAFGKKFF